MNRRERRRGSWVVVLGPDGVGKSTVLEAIDRRLGAEFPAVRRYHLRPHFGRRSAGGPPDTEPHADRPRGRIAAVAKLVWWWLDCVVGWIGWIRPALERGELVLFDRYVDDLIVDPRRYRYDAPRRWARRMSRLVPRPDAIVVLDAPVEVIRDRVKEVGPEEIERQREGYRALAEEASEGRLVDAAPPPEIVAAAVERHLRSRLGWASSAGEAS